MLKKGATSVFDFLAVKCLESSWMKESKQSSIPLNVFTEFTKFNDKNICHYSKRTRTCHPATSCVGDQDATTAPARHMWETGSLNWLQLMLQIPWTRWIHWIPVPFRKNSSMFGWPVLSESNTALSTSSLICIRTHDDRLGQTAFTRRPSLRALHYSLCWDRVNKLPDHFTSFKDNLNKGSNASVTENEYSSCFHRATRALFKLNIQWSKYLSQKGKFQCLRREFLRQKMFRWGGDTSPSSVTLYSYASQPGSIVQLETQRYKQVVTLYSYASQPGSIVQLETQRYKQVVTFVFIRLTARGPSCN